MACPRPSFGIRKALVLSLAAASTIGAHRSEGRPSAPAFREDVRAASGAAKLARERRDVLLEGSCVESGRAGRFTLRFNAKGAYRFAVESPLGSTHGFDGVTAWSRDGRGVAQTVELFDRDRWRLFTGLVSGTWFTGLDTAQVAPAPAPPNAGTIAWEIREGRILATLYLDRGSCLPDSLVSTGVSGSETWVFSDYRGDLGWKIPARIVVRTSGLLEDTYRVQSMHAVEPTRAVYDPVESHPTDATFDARAPARIEVRRAPTGHVLVHPLVDGTDVGWLIFDTGAGGPTILDEGAAAKVNLAPVGTTLVTSFAGSVQASILQGASLRLGPFELARPLLVAMDLGFVRAAIGNDVAGIIGYDVLSRSVVEIVLAEDRIELRDPARFALRDGDWMRLRLNQNLPLVPATFEGGRGLFRIDVGASSGAAGNVIFHAPIVEALDLLDGRDVLDAQIGPTRIAIGRIGWFELGGHRFEKPETIFVRDPGGPLGDAYVEGNLGVEFLKPFRIVLDFPHERVAFVERSVP